MVAVTVTSVLPLMLALTQAAVLQDRNVKAPLAGYGVQSLEWSLSVVPGGPLMTFYGTVENVTDHIAKLNPNWKEDFNLSIPVTSTSSIQKRSKEDFTRVSCERPWGWEPIDQHRIQQGIQYLRHLNPNEHPQNGPGPGNCGRVSCGYKAAIWWCNDHTEAFAVGSWNDIADGAERVEKDCRFYDRNFMYWKSVGQAFHRDNWNVIVRKDSC